MKTGFVESLGFGCLVTVFIIIMITGYGLFSSFIQKNIEKVIYLQSNTLKISNWAYEPNARCNVSLNCLHHTNICLYYEFSFVFTG